MVITALVNGALNSAAIWATIVVGAIIVYYAIWKQKRTKYARSIDKLPGPHYNSIFGHALHFQVAREDRFKKLVQLLKPFIGQPIIRLWIGLTPKFFLVNADSVEALLGNNKESDKGTQYHLLEPWLRQGLLVSSGEKWHTRRKLLTPTFHFKNLEEFLNTFNEQAEILSKKIENQTGQTVDCYELFKMCALDIICETAMGRSWSAQKLENSSDYVDAVNGIQEIVSRRSFSPWYKNDFIFQFTEMGRRHRKYLEVLHGFTNQVIKDRKEERRILKLHGNNNNIPDEDDEVFGRKKRQAFLDLLLDMAEKGSDFLTDEDIREEVDTFMFTGHDTSSTTAAWTLYMIGKHPEVQEKVQEELDLIFGDNKGDVTMYDISQLKYLERVIKETMRLYPTAPLFSRKLKEDLHTGDYTIPANSSVIVALYFLHRDPKWFPDPEKFDPDRFLPENCATRHPFAYTPFSAGTRNCIGQKFGMLKVKTMLIHLLRKFTVTSTQTTEELNIVSELVLQPLNGVRVQFHLRQ